ncbi:MAG: type II toxin-antitoxin system RelE/ParE family toxin [Methylococcales bacterium]
MHIYKNTWFQRFARREKITDQMLVDTITRAEDGLIDADLGGNIIKQRIARKGQGKSSGYRTIVIFKQGDKAFFVYGFAKSERENLKENELKYYKESAEIYLSMSNEQIDKLLKTSELTEIEQ